ncbi:MAG: zeta toxin family protein [Bacteroidales bacterium]|nr:zeta toxin family protein [Bacteroidales bacterium]
MPKMYIIAGCNGAGKTTASYTVLPGMLECSQFINSDEFAKSFNPFNPEAAAIRASRFMLMKFHYLFEKSMNFGIETTLATKTLLKMAHKAQREGYEVTILYFWLRTPDMAVERVKARVATGGHYIDEETVRRRYYVGLHYFFTEYIPFCDHWILLDNSTPPERIVARGNKNEEAEILDETTYSTIRELAYKPTNLEFFL